MRVHLLIAVVIACLVVVKGTGADATAFDVKKQEFSPALGGANSVLPPGALARVARQAPPRMNLLSELLAWPEPPPGRSAISLLTFSPDGKQLAIASGFLPIRLVDATTGKEIAQFPKKVQHDIAVLRYSDEGKLLAVSSSWNEGIQTISLWEVTTGKTIRDFPIHEKELPEGSPLSGAGYLVLSPDGGMLAGKAFGPKHDTIHIWDVATGKRGTRFVPREWIPAPYYFTPDGKHLISGGNSGSDIRLWEIATGKEVCKFARLQDRPPQFAFTPDGEAVAAGLTNGTICLWQVPSGKEIRRFQGHEQRTVYLAFSPNGLTLVSGSEDKTVRLWDVVTGEQIHVWPGHESLTGPIAFSPDGRKVASGSFDGTVFIWDFTTAARPPLHAPTQTLDQLWDDLASFDAGNAHRAFWTIAARPREGVAFLKQRLSPVRVPDERQIERLIAALNDSQFAKRQNALRHLEEVLEAAEAHLRMALKAGSQTLEGRRRIESLLEGLAETSPKMLQQRRAVAVLEAIGTKEGKAILESLAEGAKEARLTREARAALNRLNHTK